MNSINKIEHFIFEQYNYIQNHLYIQMENTIMDLVNNKFPEFTSLSSLVILLVYVISVVISILLLATLYYVPIFIIGFIIDLLLNKHYKYKNMWKKDDTKVNSNNVERIERYYLIWQRNRLKALKKYSHTTANNNKSIYNWVLFPFIRSITTYINK
ncbi:hypothetical protein RJC27_04295 [Staphylococcus epidermidis]|uniref:hypothetical protein n=1 Tax=Staphylococcus epidermidis TaxID=1282 RepID=UPI002879E8EF|nr:hypothetical protein [Staphylococcus epidermidis]MDS3939802.1 hypothetical protein [Staphylococcus epidermidis]